MKTKKAFPFLADPPEIRPYKGIQQYPGFHTTTDFNIASMYAMGRVEPDEDENGINYVDDYPVVVSLDMSGLEKQIDYDAAEMVADILQIHLDEVLNEVEDINNDQEIVDEVEKMVEFSDRQYEPVDGARDYLAQETFGHMEEPLSALLNREDCPEIVREYTRTGQIPDRVLMDAAEQYRYTMDVPDDRLLNVWYIQPTTTELIDYEEKEKAELWPGFDIIGPDEAYSGYWDPKETLVYEDTQLRFEGLEPEIEYHGTTYKRLLQAIPDLAGILPEPPSPPYREED